MEDIKVKELSLYKTMTRNIETDKYLTYPYALQDCT